jgi:hypothetical protein
MYWKYRHLESDDAARIVHEVKGQRHERNEN